MIQTSVSTLPSRSGCGRVKTMCWLPGKGVRVGVRVLVGGTGVLVRVGVGVGSLKVVAFVCGSPPPALVICVRLVPSRLTRQTSPLLLKTTQLLSADQERLV